MMIVWLTQLAVGQEMTVPETVAVEASLSEEKAVEASATEKKKVEVWFECNPMSGMLELWKVLPPSMRDNAGGFANVTPDEFLKAGGVPDGLFRAYGSEKVIMEMNYRGEIEQLGSFLTMLQPDSVVWQEEERWMMELPSDRWIVERQEDLIRLHSSTISPDVLQRPDVQTVLPSQNGCWMVVKNGPMIQRLQRQIDGGIFLPFETGAVELAFQPEQKLPSVLGQSGAVPMAVSLPQKPFGIATLGFSPLDLLDDAAFRERMGLTEKDLQKLKKRLRLQPGALILLQDMNIRQNPKVSVALALQNRFGKPQWRCLIWRGLKKSLKQQENDFIVLEKNILSVDIDGAPLYLGVEKGRLYVSTYRDGINQLMAGEGAPVVDPRFGEYAASLPLAVQVNIPPMMGMMFGGLSTVELGLKTVDDFALLSLNANISAEQILGLLVAQAQGANGQGQSSSKPPLTSYQRNMMILAAKEHQHKAETGTFLAIGQTGGEDRELENLPDGDSAFTLGWITEDDGNIYWVDTTEDGFQVHAILTPSAEGEQERHIVKKQDGSLELLE